MTIFIMTLFKYREDRIPVLIITLFFALDIIAYLVVDNIWLLIAYWLIMIAPKGIICAWNHHHQHLPTFKYTPLNYLLEQIYALQTGATSKLWVLHHVLGHHHHYLDQSKDESRWKDKKGHIMGRFRYSMDVMLTAYYRAYQVGKRHPRPLKIFIIATTVTALVVTALTWYQPVPTLFVFIIPMISSLFFTAWVTYAHHAGLDVNNDFERNATDEIIRLKISMYSSGAIYASMTGSGSAVYGLFKDPPTPPTDHRSLLARL